MIAEQTTDCVPAGIRGGLDKFTTHDADTATYTERLFVQERSLSTSRGPQRAGRSPDEMMNLGGGSHDQAH